MFVSSEIFFNQDLKRSKFAKSFLDIVESDVDWIFDTFGKQEKNPVVMNSQMVKQETHKFPSQYTDYKGDSYFNRDASGFGTKSKLNIKKKKRLSSISSEGSKDQGSHNSSLARKKSSNASSLENTENQKPQMTDSMV